jgi:hypothetical protein
MYLHHDTRALTQMGRTQQQQVLCSGVWRMHESLLLHFSSFVFLLLHLLGAALYPRGRETHHFRLRWLLVTGGGVGEVV